MPPRAKPFQSDLLGWFETAAREMPWRKSKDPYRIWVSEIMLQQTQVATVRPYFKRFMKRFPDVFALAKAPQEDVLKHWEGLGYYSRARNLHKGAKYVAEQHAGKVPNTLETILKVPGIGPYSAGAILSIAYEVAAPAIDGNVYRVISRLYDYHQDVTTSEAQKQIKTWVEKLIPLDAAGDFNQALMELGALVCSPKTPACQSCPVQKHCKAFKAGTVDKLPVKKKKKPPKKLTLLTALIRNGQGEYLLEQQSDGGIFKGLWCFPHVESVHPKSETEQVSAFASALVDQALKSEGEVFVVEHTLTHRKMFLKTHLCQPVVSPQKLSKNLAWVSVFEEHPYAMPVAHQKIVKAMQAQPLFFG